MARSTARKLLRFLISTIGVADEPSPHRLPGASAASGTWMLTLASQRRLPSCISQSETPSLAEQQANLFQIGLGLLRGWQVGLADDLQQRRAGAVEIDQAVAAGARFVVQHLAGVFFEVGADDADRAWRRPAVSISSQPSWLNGRSYWLI